MADQFTITGYEITTDNSFLDRSMAITPGLRRLFPQLLEEALEGKVASIPKFHRLIEQHPDNPQLKNYLSTLYMNAGQEEKAHEVNHWIIREHPDYLFAKINMASEYLAKEEYDRIPEVMGGEYMELQKLMPERSVFHLGEVLAFFKMSILYYTAIGNLEQAEIRLEAMEQLDPDSEEFKIAQNHTMIARFDRTVERLKREEALAIRIVTDRPLPPQHSEPPTFNHPEIKLLYHSDFGIDPTVVTALLKLPRETLVADLCMMLRDAEERFEYFKERADEEDLWFSDLSFPSHALLLLGEIRSEESLDAVLEFLSSNEEVLRFWLDDMVTLFPWNVIFNIGCNRLDKLCDFLCSPGIYTYSKTEVSSALAHYAMHEPSRSDEVIGRFRQILQRFTRATRDENLVDSDFVGLMICDLVDLRASELLPEIKQLFDLEYVSIGTSCGEYSEIEHDMFKDPEDWYIREEKTIYQWYEHFVGLEDDGPEPMDDALHDYYEVPEPIVKPKKIGRNEPCPCGSGKKYKNCCL